MKRFIAALLALLSVAVYSASIPLNFTWDPVTQYSDGTAITNGPAIKYAFFVASNSSLTNAIMVTNDLPSTNFVTSLEFVTPTNAFYFVTAYQYAGVESSNSVPVSVRIQKPKAPLAFRNP